MGKAGLLLVMATIIVGYFQSGSFCRRDLRFTTLLQNQIENLVIKNFNFFTSF